MAFSKKTAQKEVSFQHSHSEADIAQLLTSLPSLSCSTGDLPSKEQLFNGVVADGEYSSEIPEFEFEKTKRNIGIPMVAGQTENETKARKLNKTEESRLDTLRTHFAKQQTMFEKQYNQHQRRFRIRSARVLQNCNTSNGNIAGNTVSPRSRPKSLPATMPSHDLERPVFNKQASVHNDCKHDKLCGTCERIQRIIKQYEIEMKTNFDVTNTHHTVCLFSDAQIKNFINLVETKYCSDLPGVVEMLHSSKYSGVSQNHSSSSSVAKSGIQDRIKAFCRSQEEFNKKHPVSRSVKLFVDNERIKQAQLATKISKT
ncbi:uncharacterized protein LOC127725469 [Mytilus californianus]|uniref:uncharacterized protein LOC127725469 n=1 Tax=Mytilus californianus TaxID=6549 RepID=UPI0022452DF9|nr:uncharacterized protein LOC127725469 [Mytilus californianus]